MAGQISRGTRPKGRPHCLGLFFWWAAHWPVTTGRLLFFLLTQPPFSVSLSWLCSLLVAMSILTWAPQQPSSPQVPLLHLPSGCGQRLSSGSAYLEWVHFLCSSLTRADFRIICATGTAVGLRCPACHPKAKLAPPLRPLPSLRCLRPLHPLPQGYPNYRLAFIDHVHLGAPMVPLLHVVSRGR